MARSKLAFTLALKTPEDALRCRREHLSRGGLVVEAADATFGQPAEVHLDMVFFGRSYVVKGMVVSSTSFGTALQITSIPEDLDVFLDALQRGDGSSTLEEEFSENLVALPGDTSSLDVSGYVDESSEDQVSFSIDADGDSDEEVATDLEMPVPDDEAADEELATDLEMPVPDDESSDEELATDLGMAVPDDESSDEELATDIEAPVVPESDDDEVSDNPMLGEGAEFSRDAAMPLDDIPSLGGAVDALEADLAGDGGEDSASPGTGDHWRAEPDDGESGVTASSIFSELGELEEDISAEIRRMEAEISGEVPASRRDLPGARRERVIEADESVVISIEDDEADEDWADASWAQGESLDEDAPLPAPASALNPAFEQTLNPEGAPEWTTPVFSASPLLKGKVDGKAMNDLVRQIGSRRLTGVLRMKMLTRMVVGIYIDGQPIYFVSHPPEEGRSLEDALAGLEQVDVDTFDVALGKAMREERHLGLALVGLGVLTLDVLRQIAQREARKYSSQLPMRRGGTFGFWEMEIPREGGGEKVDIEAVLAWDISA